VATPSMAGFDKTSPFLKIRAPALETETRSGLSELGGTPFFLPRPRLLAGVGRPRRELHHEHLLQPDLRGCASILACHCFGRPRVDALLGRRRPHVTP